MIVFQFQSLFLGKIPSCSCLVMLCNDVASLQKFVALDIFGIFKKRVPHLKHRFIEHISYRESSGKSKYRSVFSE